MENRPIRVQLSRAKGWRKPENTVVVSRPSKWGNPYDWRQSRPEVVVSLYRQKLLNDGLGPIQAILTCEDVRRELRGKNLACWCSLGMACHADVLLEIANSDPAQPSS